MGADAWELTLSDRRNPDDSSLNLRDIAARHAALPISASAEVSHRAQTSRLID
jgi:hypothetical protein